MLRCTWKFTKDDAYMAVAALWFNCLLQSVTESRRAMPLLVALEHLPLITREEGRIPDTNLIWRHQAKEAAMEMSSRVRKARAMKGYSQEELARRLKVTRSAVANWECGAKLPSSARLQALAILTDVSYEWLATGRGSPELAPDWTPAVDAEIVDEPAEVALLRAYRSSTKPVKKSILAFVASTSPAARRLLAAQRA